MQVSNPQSHLRFPLTQLFASAGHVRVMRALMAYGAPLSVAQLAADGGLSTRGTRLVLESLTAQGIVAVLGQPRSQLYAVVAQHPLATALKTLFDVERDTWVQLQENLRQALASQSDILAAWLYGSVARGEDGPTSDVDVALVINKSSAAAAHTVRDHLQALGDQLGLHFSAVVLTPKELAGMQANDAWWTNLTKDAKVLKGSGPGQTLARFKRLAR